MPSLLVASSELELISLVWMQCNGIWTVVYKNKYSFSDLWMHWHWRFKEMESRYNIFINNRHKTLELNLIRVVIILVTFCWRDFCLPCWMQTITSLQKCFFLDCFSTTQFKALHQFICNYLHFHSPSLSSKMVNY